MDKKEQDWLFDKCLDLFYYKDGYLLWKNKGSRRSNVVNPDTKWGKQRQVNIEGKTYSVSKIIYLMHHRIYPSSPICYIDRDNKNTRIENMVVYPEPPIY